MDFFGFYLGDMSAMEAVKSNNEGGIDPWDQSRYLNIWVCNMAVNGSPVILGYATPPTGMSNWPPGTTAGMSDGVLVQSHDFVSTIHIKLSLKLEVFSRSTSY